MPRYTSVNYFNALKKLSTGKKKHLVGGEPSDKNNIAVAEGFSNENTRSTLKSGSLQANGQPMKKFTPTFTKYKLAKLPDSKISTVNSKFDVERFEYKVTSGAAEINSQINPLIICEVLPYQDKSEYIEEQSKFFQLLPDLGYLVERIKPIYTLARVSPFRKKAICRIPHIFPYTRISLSFNK
jgi:hypothetical protein